MLKIRLRRMGSRHRPFYRVVVSDSRRVPTSSALDEIGTYDPRKRPSHIDLDLERVDHWLERGARPSPTVKKIVATFRRRPAITETEEAEAETTKEEEVEAAAAAETETESEDAKAAAESEDAKAEDAKADDAKAAAEESEKAEVDDAPAEEAASEDDSSDDEKAKG